MADSASGRLRPTLISAGLVAAVTAAALVVVLEIPRQPPQWPRLLLATAVFAAGMSCVFRAWLLPVQRLAWGAFGAGALCYAAGTAYNAIALRPHGLAPSPSPADAGWLLFYPCAYGATVVLTIAISWHRHWSVWLDGVIVATALAALAAGFVVPGVLANTSSDHPLLVAISMAYPLGDLVLLALALSAASRARLRLTTMWWLLAAAFLLLTLADVRYASHAARHNFVFGGLTDAGFPVAFVLIGVAAWQPGRSPRPAGPLSSRALVLPLGMGLIGVALVVLSRFHQLSVPAYLFAVATVVLAGGRVIVFQRGLRPFRESAALLRAFEETGVGMAIATPDGYWLRVNSTLAGLLGVPAREVVGSHIDDRTHPDDRGHGLPSTPPAGGGRLPPFERRFVRPDGAVVETLVSATAVTDPDSGAVRYSLHVHDVTEAARAARSQAALVVLGKEALAATEPVALFHAAVRIVAGAMAAYEVTVLERDDRDGSIAELPGWRVLAGSPAAAGPEPGRPGRHELLVDILTRDDQRFALRAADDRRGGFDWSDRQFLTAVASVLASAIDRMNTEEQVRRSALHDHLTGLGNRALSTARLDQALAHARRAGSLVAVLLLDLDDFKAVNDTLGHAAGDSLLRAMAPRLRAAVRTEDLVARLGGDEFLVVCGDVHGEAEVLTLAHRVQAALDAPLVIEGHELALRASIGIALSDGGGAPEGLLRDADLAMYRAKELGGHTFEVFDEALRSGLLDRVATERALRQALERDEFRLRYQPIIDLRTGALARFEALLRWHRPGHGELSPDRFLPIAERSGVIRALGSWVLRHACDQLAAWNTALPDHDPVTVAVNLSARQIGDELVDEVAGVLRASGVAPRQLETELTEHLLMDVESAARILQRLRELGVTVTLDDFGAGYSSLGQLRSLRLDTIKLDRSFIADVREADGQTASILRAVTEMAQALHITVVAEGVETGVQLAAVRAAGCHLAQGFLLAPPLRAAECTELLRGGATWEPLVAAVSTARFMAMPTPPRPVPPPGAP